MTNSIGELELSNLSPILQKYAGRQRDALLPMLHECQELIGWLPRDVQFAVAETLRIPLADIHGVIEFYSMFYNKPMGRKVIRVCEDIACRLAGADELMTTIASELGLGNGETDPKRDISLEFVPCLGMCEHAPAALFSDQPVGDIKQQDVLSLLANDYKDSSVKAFGTAQLCTEQIGKIDPSRIEDYLEHGGFEVLKQVVNQDSETIIEQITESNILGRGGAMFPLGLKWRFTREAAGETRHIIINADESEPGTFKDRVLMESNPFAVVESAIVAGYAVGAELGWIFIRGEYPLAYERLNEAIRQAYDKGFLGKNILGKKDFHFSLKLRRGAGAYICGEETALFEAIEGKRGFPRIKPPFPTTSGLFRQPTAINNVETLLMALVPLRLGVTRWREYGTSQSPGTKLFCLSGHVAKPGLYEVPFGITIRELISLAGGVPGGRKIQALLLGGAAGVFAGPDIMDMPLTYENARANNIPIGSGVVMVFDETVDMRQVVLQIGRFFAHESCGKCFPCQLGTQRQLEILEKNANGETKPTDKLALEDIGLAMTETSLCGLGQTAASAVISALELWPEKFS